MIQLVLASHRAAPVCLAIVALLCCFSRATASTFVVSNLADSAATVGSLRWAVAQANNHTNNTGDPTDTIEFDPAFFNVPRIITLTNGQLQLTDTNGATIIAGPGEGLLTISGNHASRVFLVQTLFTGNTGGIPGPPAVKVEIRDLTIADGICGTGGSPTPRGGGIHNSGRLTLDHVTVRDCTSIFTNYQADAWGGGIFNYGILTITNGTVTNNLARTVADTLNSSAYGGGILNWSTGTITLNSCLITSNRVEALNTAGSQSTLGASATGGGVENDGTATLDQTIVTNNVADAQTRQGISSSQSEGGGIYNSGPLTLQNGCVLSGNAATASTAGLQDATADGGGLDSSGGPLAVTDTVIQNNTAAISDTLSGHALGGGVFASGTYRSCTLSGNIASATGNGNVQAWGGGAIAGPATFLNSSISGNLTTVASANPGVAAFSYGGGIYGGPLDVLNSTMVGNQSVAGGAVGIAIGGAIYLNSGSLGLSNSTVVANVANSQGTNSGEALGGGIYGSWTAGNSILTGNSVSAVAASPTLVGPNADGTVNSQGHNLIGDTNGATGFVSSDLTGIAALDVFQDVDGNGRIDAGDLAGNGGPTGNLALKSGSPAINAGDNALIPIDPATGAPVTTDQRGAGYPRIVSSTVDIGAYEATVPNPGVYIFEGYVNNDFLNPTNWNGLGTPTPGAIAAGETYIVATNATLSGAATVNGKLTINSGVTLTIATNGTMVQGGSSVVTVANTGVLDNFGSYTLHGGTSLVLTTLTTGDSGGFVNEAGATLTRDHSLDYTELGGRFTNHGTFAYAGGVDTATWASATFINATNGTATFYSAAGGSFFTLDNAGMMTAEESLDDNEPSSEHAINSGTFNAPYGWSANLTSDCVFSNTASGIVNVSGLVIGLDNAGVVNLTGDSTFMQDQNGDAFINRTGGTINQGAHTVALNNNLNVGSTLTDNGTWTGSGQIDFTIGNIGLVIGNGGTLINNGSWTFSSTANSISVGGMLAGRAVLNLPATNQLHLTGGQLACTTTTAGNVSVTANSILSGSLTLEQANMSGAGILTVTGILGTGSGSNNVSCPLDLTNDTGQVLDVAAGTGLHETGALTWTAGDVSVGGTWEHGQNPLEVPTGATLGGGGTAVGNVAVQAAGEIAPGSSPGTFTIAGSLTNAGIYQCDVNGTNADQLVVTTHLDLTGSTLDFNVLSNGVTGNPYVIATYGTLSGAFATISNLPVGMSLNYAYDDGVSSNHIALVNGIAPSLLHWPLEAGRGTNITEAISGKTNVAFLTGPVVWTNGIAPDSSNAISVAIDTPPSYVDAGTLTTNDTYVAGSDPGYRVLSNNWSITAWVRLRNPQGATGDRVIASSVFDSNDGWLFLVNGFYAPDDLAFDFGSDRSYSGLRLPLNQAVFVAILADSSAGAFGSSTNRHRFAVWNGSTWHYSDGTQFINIRLEGLALGAFNSGQRQFDGVIDDVRIYNRTLNQSELDFLAAHPPTLMIAPAGPKLAKVSWTPAATNWVLQESTSLSPAAWTNSPSAFTNPIVVPATVPAKFYRLFKP